MAPPLARLRPARKARSARAAFAPCSTPRRSRQRRRRRKSALRERRQNRIPPPSRRRGPRRGPRRRAVRGPSDVKLRSLFGKSTALHARAGRAGNGYDHSHGGYHQDEQGQADGWYAGGEGWLTAEGVQKTYKKRMVVKGVSLAVGRGEAVGLLGPNGAGKTTVFYMITGLVPADAGRITLDGRDVTNLPMYRRARLGVGYLPQEASIFRGLTVEQNIMAV